MEGVMVFNATFNNSSAIVAVSFIGGGNRSTRRKPPTNFIMLNRIHHTISGIRTHIHNISGDRH